VEFRVLDTAVIAVAWRDSWGEVIVSKGNVIRPGDVEGVGLFTDSGELAAIGSFVIRADEAEVVSLEAVIRGAGHGRALLAEIELRVAARGAHRGWLITTNDNVHAIGVCLHAGYRLVAVHLDAMDAVRKLKPQVPQIGENGLPLRDEWEFEKWL
jgi:GNAT superfamily N-acetyltransferase